MSPFLRWLLCCLAVRGPPTLPLSFPSPGPLFLSIFHLWLPGNDNQSPEEQKRALPKSETKRPKLLLLLQLAKKERLIQKEEKQLRRGEYPREGNKWKINLKISVDHFKTAFKEVRAAIKGKLSDKEIDSIKKVFGIMFDKSKSDAYKIRALKAIAKKHRKGFMGRNKKLEAKVKAMSKFVDFFTKEIYDKASPRVKNFLNAMGNFGKNFFENIEKSDAELEKGHT
ncbi:hypothetical protein WR25_03122 [Diploscapter pachys]|uniref:SXP/RAL-2 family protein Ani s 5-like cation-binding domain-containing protein n=1 Tax=Diploscapter pachys TaxID=2018661 RepID=A0A2A2JJ17_9BILA|nr:hypothetical protein WR25_03122 [Diploscapter pachys]